MKILILASGGDSAGMNTAIFYLTKYLPGDLYVCYRGFEGLIKNEIFPLDNKLIYENRFQGGVIIKSSRSKSFMTKLGFNKAIKNLRENEIDKLIILGGNGSFEGAKKLSKYVDIAFIPSTIDNDFGLTDYCIGFDTASSQCKDYIEKVKVSLSSFERVGIYEVMGRDCDNLSKKVALLTNADVLITEKLDANSFIKKINKLKTSINSPTVILKEKLYSNEELNQIFNCIKKDFKYCQIGYYQRGGDPTQIEINKCKLFAKKLAKNIEKSNFVVVEENDNIVIKLF